MLKAKTVALMLIVGILSINTCKAETLEKNWNDYLHYTLIGRLDMAKAYAQAIIDGDPNSEQLLALSEDNPNSYSLLQRAKATPHDKELAQLSEKLWDIIEEGRNIRRTKAKVIVTDSGGMQKEAYWLRIPCVTLRDETEWAETVESGWNMLVGSESNRILRAVKDAHPGSSLEDVYSDGKAAEKIVQLISSL